MHILATAGFLALIAGLALVLASRHARRLGLAPPHAAARLRTIGVLCALIAVPVTIGATIAASTP